MTGKTTYAQSVLVIDDNQPLANALFKQIVYLGFDAKTCYSVDELYETQNLNQFDLVLCDILLGDRTAVDVWEYFCQINYRPNIIYMSGNLPGGMNELLIQSSPYAVLEKPIYLKELRNLLTRMTCQN